MIKLEINKKPEKLTTELQKSLTEEYKREKKAVWKKSFIKEAVEKIAFGKCCYSECRLGEEGNYMEIDHFYPKKYFPNKIVEWGNLLPTSKKCNSSKSSHNTMQEPIIHPCFDNPKEHLYIKDYRFYSKTPKGRLTIDIVSLNSRKHFVNKRFRNGNKILEILEDIKNGLEENKVKENIRIKNRILNKLKDLLREGTKENEYSATISTVILQSPDFMDIVNVLKKEMLWNSEFDNIFSELKYCSLPPPI